VYLYQQGQLKTKVTDEMLREILARISRREKPNIRIIRK
jgi:DNA-binding TFAR19-related protein (PDSD5 family)